MGTVSNKNKSISLDDLAALNEEIASLVRVGVPLELGLSQLGHDVRRSLRGLTERLAQRMRGGASLDDAIAAEGDSLPRIYRAVVRTGLRAGRLPEALEALTGFALTVEDLRKRITLAMLYPSIVLLVAYGLFVGFLITILPGLVRIFALFDLPLLSGIELLYRVRPSVAWWGPVLPILFVMVWAWWAATGDSALSVDANRPGYGRRRRWVGWLPGVKNFDRANFAELAALLIEHGAPLPEAFELSGEAVGDQDLSAEVLRLAQEVQTGRSLAESVDAAVSLPPFMRWMMANGERQSALAPALRQVTDVYRRRAQHQAEWFKLMLPVALILIVGGGATLMWGLTLFVPLTELYRSLGLP